MDASRDVARVVSDVSALCPPTVDASGNRPGQALLIRLVRTPLGSGDEACTFSYRAQRRGRRRRGPCPAECRGLPRFLAARPTLPSRRTLAPEPVRGARAPPCAAFPLHRRSVLKGRRQCQASARRRARLDPCAAWRGCFGAGRSGRFGARARAVATGAASLEIADGGGTRGGVPPAPRR